MSNEHTFDSYARYYDLLYRDKDYKAEADYIAALIRRYRPDAHTILDLGSGSGLHAILLSQKGFKVQGVERSEEMMRLAEKKLKKQPNSKTSDLVFPSAPM